MKWFLLIFSVLFISFVSAGSIDLVQDEYYPGETLQAYLYNYSSNPLTNIYILDINNSEVSVAPLVVEYREDEYFVYFNLPTIAEGNYELVVVNDRVNFSVINNTEFVSIKPGIFVLNGDKSVKIEVKSVGSVNLEISSDNSEVVPRKTIKSLSDETWDLYVDIGDVSSDSIISVSYNGKGYQIPFIYPAVDVEIVENVTEVNDTEVVVEPVDVVDALEFVGIGDEQHISFLRTEVFEAELKVKNNLDEDLDVSYELTGDLESILDIDSAPTSIGGGEEGVFNLVLNKNKGALPKEYQGDLKIIYGEEELVMSFFIEVADEEVEPVEDITFDDIDFGEPVAEEGIDSVMIIGFVLIGILLVILFILYRKMKQKPTKDYNEVLKERIKK
ncbi:MAG: hypothetical protein ABIJ18_01745 [archaeon]